MKDIMADLKIDKTMTFHRVQHGFRTIAAKKGIRDGIAERIMGHAEGNDIKDIYTHLHDEDIVKEVRDRLFFFSPASILLSVFMSLVCFEYHR